MDFYPDLLKRSFSRLKASPEKIQEVIDMASMTENKRKPKIVRRMLVAAVLVALAVLTAAGVSAMGGGKVFSRVTAFMGGPGPIPEVVDHKCLVRIENDYGEETSFLANRLEYDRVKGKLKVWMNTAEGEEMWFILEAPDAKSYGSYAEMMAKEGNITGTTTDGGKFEITAEP